jgi:hypothetical protein
MEPDINTEPGTAESSQQPMLQFMTTEHFTLQTARSATIAETNGRASMYLNAVTGVIVALAFVGQISAMGEAFFIFGFVLFPSVLFLGVATFVRVLQLGIEDMIYARGINRIRHFYAEVAPRAQTYFILSTHDDIASSSLRNVGLIPAGWQLFMTAAGMVQVINGVVAGVLVGMVISWAFALSLPIGAAAGIAVFLFSVAAQQRYQARYWERVEEHLDVRFPNAPELP